MDTPSKPGFLNFVFVFLFLCVCGWVGRWVAGGLCFMNSVYDKVINPYLTNVSSHRYHLGESTFFFRGLSSDF